MWASVVQTGNEAFLSADLTIPSLLFFFIEISPARDNFPEPQLFAVRGSKSSHRVCFGFHEIKMQRGKKKSGACNTTRWKGSRIESWVAEGHGVTSFLCFSHSTSSTQARLGSSLSPLNARAYHQRLVFCFAFFHSRPNHFSLCVRACAIWKTTRLKYKYYSRTLCFYLAAKFFSGLIF